MDSHCQQISRKNICYFNINKSKKLEELQKKGADVSKDKIASKELELDNLIHENEQLGIKVMDLSSQIETEKVRLLLLHRLKILKNTELLRSSLQILKTLIMK